MPATESDDVEVVVGLVLDHPGCTAAELAELVAAKGLDPRRTNRLLQAAVRRGDVIVSQSTFWAIRDTFDGFEEI
ncbi:hypothetical protein SAMN05192561_101813 [Halopenitus malekzadehii]|uniref:MarR family transcriptional regulator n=1 Tax=Halopenitus malekzadehii TaxID=1267564 RepID=A0A1H6I0Y1_9EURY|nr:hypothetical protein [Halopenitus malekzadehii]SEH41684.1 hypothetical protein SAMN05192561_101813 [Halopenitus malekzadehii]